VTVSSTRVRARCRWRVSPPADPTVVATLRDELRVPEAVCRLVAARGYSDVDRAKRYLRPRLEHLVGLGDPAAMLDLDRAVDRLARAARVGETVLVHGDYDVDGICSTTLMVRTLTMLGARAVPFIPSRLTDGYDLGAAGVRAALDVGATVVLTCDCGTSAIGPVAELQSAGVDVIIADHHLPGGPLPPAYAVLNPKRPGCPSPDKDLAAVGVAFRLAMALTRSMGGNENAVLGMLDLVALATVADVAPLRGENRVLVRSGLRMLAETHNVGLQALIRSSGLEGKPLTAGRIGFVLAPRLNAVGRLDRAIRGVELLRTRELHDAHALARSFEELNARRQDIDRATLEEARALLAGIDLKETYGIVLAQQGWHPGVIGIVASRIVEEHGRPTLLIALDGAEGKGSGRSIPAFDLHAGLGECRDLLVRFGGHRSAAGVTVAIDRIPELARRFNEVARSRLTPDDLIPELRVDLDLPLADVTAELETILRYVEPCGMGNPAPVLMVRDVRVAGAVRAVGRDGLRCVLTGPAGGATLATVGWGIAARAAELAEGTPLDVAFRLERDEWNGNSTLQARLLDFRSAGAS
jgi:single-stranded-DNA-specific exonuclease